MFEAKMSSKQEFELRPKTAQPINLCWERVDVKSKKLQFMITQNTSGLDEKAKVDTVESISAKIESLKLKLDRISMNIAAQNDVEREHFERKCMIMTDHISHTNCHEVTDMDMHSENGLCSDRLQPLSVLHNKLLQPGKQTSSWRSKRHQPVC